MKRIMLISFILFLVMLFIPLITCIGSMNIESGNTSEVNSSFSDIQNIGEPSKLTSTTESNTEPDKNNNCFILYDLSSGDMLTLSEKEYVFGAVASEMPESYGIEALKAQAVACYTNAVRCRRLEEEKPDPSLHGAHFSCDLSKSYGYITDEQLKKRWGDEYEESMEKLNKAVDEVLGKVITYNGQPILASYHAISSGKTEQASVFWEVDAPYLQSVDSSFDKEAENYHTCVTYTNDEIIDILKANCKKFKYDESNSLIEIIKTSEVGNVTSVYAGNIEMSGAQLRTLLDLRSSVFTITENTNSITFDVYGYGHGVGMSQYGAGYLAQNGKTYEEILKYYYKDVVITDSDYIK